MPSSVIHDTHYDPHRHVLSIVFVSGRRYVYFGVSPDIAASFDRAQSRGVFFNRYIRDHYAYREITDHRRRRQHGAW